MDVFCSTIIPTVGRRTLARAVCSVLEQDFHAASSEVVVVNDSGHPLPEMDWQKSERVRVIDTNRLERSVARNSGAAVAHGKYLHFLDDDDLLLPGALAAFWALEQTSDAAWLYGSYRNVDNDGKVVAEWRPGLTGDVFALLIAGEGIPFQASFIRTSHFFASGGFDPDPNIIGVEDRELGRRMAFHGLLAYTPAVVAQIRIGAESSTTDWAVIAERDRLGREKALHLPGARQRLHHAAQDDYLCGRVGRAYFASAVWNLKSRQLRTGVSRAVTSLSLTAPHCLSSAYWRGLRTKIE